MYVTVEKFQSKMEPEAMNWRNLTHAPSKEWNLRTKRLISNAQFTEDPEDTYLLTDQLTSRQKQAQANELTAWMSLSSHSYKPGPNP